MGRPKGLPKTGGRKAGATNKITADVKAVALRYCGEAIEGLVGIARDVGAPPAARVAAWDKVLDRAIGKAPQALTGEDGGPIGVRFTFALDRPNARD